MTIYKGWIISFYKTNKRNPIQVEAQEIVSRRDFYGLPYNSLLKRNFKTLSEAKNKIHAEIDKLHKKEKNKTQKLQIKISKRERKFIE